YLGAGTRPSRRSGVAARASMADWPCTDGDATARHIAHEMTATNTNRNMASSSWHFWAHARCSPANSVVIAGLDEEPARATAPSSLDYCCTHGWVGGVLTVLRTRPVRSSRRRRP